MTTVPAFRARKGKGPPLVVLTAYDAATASAAEAGGVDAILVGDSLGMVVLGHETTKNLPDLPITGMNESKHQSTRWNV